MKRFIESICLRDGKIRNLDLHQARLDRALRAHFAKNTALDLERALAQHALPQQGLYKVRLLYSDGIERIDVEVYTRRAVRSVVLVEAEHISYEYKFADRNSLDALRCGVPVGVEPLVVQKGLLTDALYANLVVYDGKRWLTPETPLLEGTARNHALASEKITPAAISVTDWQGGAFTHFKLINAMALFDEADEYLVMPTLFHQTLGGA